MNIFDSFKILSKLFKEKGFSLYVVGGAVRDYLLNIPITDVDLVTDATPEQMKEIVENGDFTFEKYGFVKVKFQGFSFDITTLRIEEEYSDFRHPKTVKFTKKLDEDCLRRDFTINAIYMDESFKIYDFVGGIEDLKNNVLRMIGDPLIRLKEDPLRIIRALRFSLTYKLEIDSNLKSAINDTKKLLELLNPDKIKQDILKIKNSSKEEIFSIFANFGIQKYLDMIE